MQTTTTSKTLQQRRTLARSLREQWSTDAVKAVELAQELARDPKWEVRQYVADSLPLAPEDPFRRLAAQLSSDPSYFVRQSTERAIDRRQRAKTRAIQRRQQVEQWGAGYDEFRRLYGRSAAGHARRLVDQLFDSLVGVVAHDLQGMLAPITAHAASLVTLADSGTANPASVAKHASRLRDRAVCMKRLIEELLAYSRPVPQQRREELLSPLIHDAMAQVREHFSSRGISLAPLDFSIDVPPNLTVEVAREQVKQAVAHLINNAVESFLEGTATLCSGLVHIRASIEKQRARIEVRDNGPGVDPEHLAELREFVPGRTTKGGNGTGLGLPTVHRYVAAHGGDVTMESSQGQGTTVILSIPLEAMLAE